MMNLFISELLELLVYIENMELRILKIVISRPITHQFSKPEFGLVNAKKINY